MKLSISNIAWSADQDRQVYVLMKKYGYSGLEIAPTRIFPEKPYDQLSAAAGWAEELRTQYGLSVSSMQSIWYGVQERVFGSEEEQHFLIGYTKKAILFAEAAGCPNLVFGCPRNRFLPEGADAQTAVYFFRELAEDARTHHTVIAMEANPLIYHTNYINTTSQAIELVRTVRSPGMKINLDMGTILENKEPLTVLEGITDMISHVHISEPGLKKIEKRTPHQELSDLLKKEHYQGYVSIETGKTECLSELEETMAYVKEVFE